MSCTLSSHLRPTSVSYIASLRQRLETSHWSDAEESQPDHEMVLRQSNMSSGDRFTYNLVTPWHIVGVSHRVVSNRREVVVEKKQKIRMLGYPMPRNDSQRSLSSHKPLRFTTRKKKEGPFRSWERTKVRSYQGSNLDYRNQNPMC
jgi:hypothetical protein